MMKRVNKLLSISLVFSLLLAFLFPIGYAAKSEAEVREKNEVIYARLTEQGASDTAYVVNVFEVIEAGEIIDYGNYSAVKNLTDLSELRQNKDEIQFTAAEGKFYYQGNLQSIDLPWNIDVSYYLDGRLVETDELLGKDGELEIKIQTTANEVVDSNFFDHYTLQITVPFDVEKFTNIQAEEATIASAGKTDQVTFTLLPEEEATLAVTANVIDFELDGIEIVAIPFMMALDDFDTDEMVDDMGELSEAISEVHDGVSKLNEGVRALRSGTGDLQLGSTQFEQGLNDLNSGSAPLVNGSHEIKKALTEMKNELSFVEDIDISDLQQLIVGLEKLESGLREIAYGLEKLADAYGLAFHQLDEAVEKIPERNKELELTDEEIGLMIAQGISQEKIVYLMENYEVAQTINAMFNDPDFVSLFTHIELNLQESSASLHEIADGLLEMNEALNETLNEFKGLDQVTKLIDGLNEFVTAYDSFHEGLIAYTNGVNELATVYGDLHSGISELAKGTDDLSSGTTELHDGTAELKTETASLPEDMQEEIDEYLKTYDHSDFEARSFLSDKNEEVELVQFILRTEAITHPEINEDEEETDEKKGFWQMLKNLFTSSS